MKKTNQKVAEKDSEERDYSWLLQTRSGNKWNKIGTDRRAGMCVPLFSVYSKNSTGIGEIADIKLLIDICRASGISILQLLPLNDMGYDFSPYNSISTFALEPAYITLKDLKGTSLKSFAGKMKRLREAYPAGNQRVNYEVKKAKLELLMNIFESSPTANESFDEFKTANMHWLRYYSLFRLLTGMNEGKEWTKWELMHKYLSPGSLTQLFETRKWDIEFNYWVQWQLYEQMKEVKKYAEKKGVLIMGDLPFLVSRNSADVWAYKNYFKLHLASGAPPDMYFAKGQKWGMPPYDWAHIRTDNYNYIRSRLRYAENFYDMFRIDHFVGLFRIWTVDSESKADDVSREGSFDPPYEQLWHEHGREIINVMNESTTMLPCAEDLGTVPECSDAVLREFGIPGMNVQRWEKRWAGFSSFIQPDEYRDNSNSVISTHDSSSFPDWFEREAGTIDKTEFEFLCQSKGLSEPKIKNLTKELFDTPKQGNRLRWKQEISNVYLLMEKFEMDHESLREIINLYLSTYNEREVFLRFLSHSVKTKNATTSLAKKNLGMIFSTNSVFSIQLLTEYLFLDKDFLKDFKYFRVNIPGSISKDNWSAVITTSLNDILKMQITAEVKELAGRSGRK